MQELDLTLPCVFANLALDEALLNAADAKGGPSVLRTWELPEPAVVLGATGRWRQEVHVSQCQADGVPIARRSSGGGTVVIGPGALNVTVVLPIAEVPGIGAVDEAQRFVLQRIADALRRLGPPVEVLGSGDLTLGRRKFAGSAQRRLKKYFFVHVSILYDFELNLISRYLGKPARQPSYRAGRSHREFVTNLGLPRASVLDAVRAAWRGLEGPRIAPEVPMEAVNELVATKFGDRAWIERF